MDIFCEYIVKKKTTPKDMVKKTGIVLGALVLCELFLIFNNLLFGFGFLLIAATVYGAVFLMRRCNIEYEYILTNSILDIDKIFAKSSRKRAMSIDFKSVEAFGLASEAPSSPATEIDLAGDIKADNVYYAEFFKDGDKKRVYFQPNEKILRNLHTVAPRVVPPQNWVPEE
ncbi:MAG: hypothetical protein E7417_05490 [Ruminococcaceae bacterium]|nr:hypothetical protein [Oscillospiraceae bacterium]